MSNDRLKYPFNHEWHVSINKYVNSPEMHKSNGFMYEAKTMADEIPRMIILFKNERLGKLPGEHQQCSQQEPEEIKENHLSCCKGVKCSECPQLLALELIERVTPEDIDTAKAWTCASHIVSTGGDIAREGYLMTLGDKMFWSNVYESLAQSDGEV
jgi:hypothetical protein